MTFTKSNDCLVSIKCHTCFFMIDYCPENPTCTGDSRTIPDTTAIGEVLFTINGQQGAGSTGDLTYSFVSPTPAYFHVDQSSGNNFITSTKS